MEKEELATKGQRLLSQILDHEGDSDAAASLVFRSAAAAPSAASNNREATAAAAAAAAEEEDETALSFEDQIQGFIDGVVPEEDATKTNRPRAEHGDHYKTDQVSELYCTTCKDDFCGMCFLSLHRKGSRKRHRALKWPTSAITNGKLAASQKEDAGPPDVAPTENDAAADDSSTSSDSDDDDEGENKMAVDSKPVQYQDGYSGNGAWYIERAKYIPIRLSLKERKLLRLLEAALNVSEYTDKVDVYVSMHARSKRMVDQLRDICSILSGLMLAQDFQTGQTLLKDRNFDEYSGWFQTVFEVGRRYKIMSPEKMRSSYGKLIYLLQDSQDEVVREMLEFDCATTLRTVHTVLTETECLDMLSDSLMPAATMEIMSKGRARHAIQADIRKKERAIEKLANVYCSEAISEDRIKSVLYSIGDQHAFLRGSRDIVDRAIRYLETFFPETSPSPQLNLSIQIGEGGSRLSHDHRRQFIYCKQTLYLWREILHDFFKLWSLAEADLLDEANPYRLRDTGQGLNRLQGCPRVSREMHAILARVMQSLGRWVGSSVIHLGDANVPNALMFIDKYTQVPRILGPIVTCLDQIDTVAEKNEQLADYLDATFGEYAKDGQDGVEGAKVAILRDFFRHAFDGRGADNAFSAGSCIDGRLTSAWQWTSEIEKKTYFPVFLLTGFIGFDGDFH